MNAELEKEMESVGKVDEEIGSPLMWLLKLLGIILSYVVVVGGSSILLCFAIFPGIVFELFLFPVFISIPLLCILFGINRKLALWLMYGYPLLMLLVVYGVMFCSVNLHWFYFPSVYRVFYGVVGLSGFGYFFGLLIVNVTLAIVKVMKKR